MRHTTLILPTPVRRAVIQHAWRDRPRECCGFLIGSGRRALFALPMQNLSPTVSRYRVDDAAHVRVRRLLRGFAPPLAIVGVYHSHPAGRPVPSPTDIAEAMYPDWTYVIVGLSSGRARVGAFQIAAGRVKVVGILRQ